MRLALVACASVVLAASANAQPPRRAATLALTIGGDDAKGDAYTFSEIRTVASAKDGRVFVLDSKDCIVKVFSAAGDYLFAFGHRGAGPGEFTRPADMTVSDTDIVVRDGNARRARFSLAGKSVSTLVDTAASFVTATYPLPHGFRLRKRDAGISGSIGGPKPDPFSSLTLERFGAQRVDTLARLRSSAVFFIGPKAYGAVRSGFEDGGAWAFSGDTLLAIVDGFAGTATWYTFVDSGARPVRRASLGQAAKLITAKEISAMEAQLRAGDPAKNMLASPDIKFLEAPTHHSIASRAVFDNLGGLWVGGAPSASQTIAWTVFPVVGRAFVVELPAAFTLSSVRGDNLLGYAQSSAGVPVVQVYHLGR